MAAGTRELICISCPVGCQLRVDVEDGEVTSVVGNRCPRGEAYGRSEVLHPVRVVTTTLPVGGVASGRRVPVKTASPVPKEAVADVIAALAPVRVMAPLAVGEVICADVAGTGVDVVATGAVTA